MIWKIRNHLKKEIILKICFLIDNYFFLTLLFNKIY